MVIHVIFAVATAMQCTAQRHALKEQRRHSRTRTHSRATQCLANDGKTPIMNLLLGGETDL